MANETERYPPIRRVVTGHDAKQAARILIDAKPLGIGHPVTGGAIVR